MRWRWRSLTFYHSRGNGGETIGAGSKDRVERNIGEGDPGADGCNGDGNYRVEWKAGTAEGDLLETLELFYVGDGSLDGNRN